MKTFKSILITGIMSTVLILLMISCGTKPKSVVMDYIEAHNAHDVTRALSFFADSARYIWEEGWMKVGIKEIREVEEFDAYTHNRLEISKVETRKDTVFCTLEEVNDFHKKAGIQKIRKITRFIVEDSRIVEYKYILYKQSWGEIKENLKPFREWAQKERSQEFGQLVLNGEFRYGFNGAKRWMALMDEWSASQGAGN